MLVGTIVNALSVLTGSLLGVFFSQLASHHLSGGSTALGSRLQTIIMQGVSLCVIYLGVSGSLKGQNSLIAILAMVIGALIGETLDLDQRMHQLGDRLQEKVGRLIPGSGNHSIADGFVSGSLLYCVGAMAIVGALQDGLTGDHSTLFAKALLDGITAIILASSLGVGVAFSSVALLLYQGFIAVTASYLAPYLNDAVVAEMTCVGSLLILAIGLNMLNLTKIKIMNLLPGVFLPIFLCMFM